MEIERLKRWFLKNKRDLPWRKNPTPYQVWVSEVMLQQTQVSVVIDYYLKWMDLFPSVKHLAEASLDQVIKVWEGLGYYSRARRLHAAAQELVDLYDGELPSDESLLSKISGLGPYTTNAILSFAYHQKKAAVDGNVVRVFTRYVGLKEDVGRAQVVRSIREGIAAVLPDEEPWIVMEGLIELGALVCKKRPLCERCPLQASCKAYEEGHPEKYPVKKPREASVRLERQVMVIISNGYVLLRQEKEEKKIMAHLWEFPYIEDFQHTSFQLPEWLERYFPNKVAFAKQLPEVMQYFTKYAVRLHPSIWIVVDRPLIEGYEWVSLTQLEGKAFSAGHRKVLHYIETCDQ